MKVRLDQGVEAVFDADHNENEEGVKAAEAQIEMVKNFSMQLHKEMSDLRKTGSEEQAVSSATTTKVIVFGVVSVGIIVGSAVIQILYLRRFFREKKIM